MLLTRSLLLLLLTLMANDAAAHDLQDDAHSLAASRAVVTMRPMLPLLLNLLQLLPNAAAACDGVIVASPNRLLLLVTGY